MFVRGRYNSAGLSGSRFDHSLFDVGRRAGPEPGAAVVSGGPPTSEAGVDVTVLIATRNRAEPLARTLESLVDQELGDLTWEIVVVDNGSTDETPSVLRAAAKRLPIVAMTEPLAGKSRALNRALEMVRGDLIVFTDDDVEAAPDWVASLVAASGRWPEENVFGGAIIPRFPEGTPQWLQDADFPHGRWAYSAYVPRPDEGPTSDTPIGPNMAIRASALEGLRFDETLGPRDGDFVMGEEVDLALRMWRRGEMFIFVPDARVTHILADGHLARSNLDERAFRCGRGNARLFPEVSNVPLFGIPLYHLMRAARAAVRLVTTTARSDRERWIASMEWHQVRGNIAERLASRRRAMAGDERVPYQPLFPSLPKAAAAVRRDGVGRSALRVVRALARPIVRHDQVVLFEADTTTGPHDDEGRDVRIAVFAGAESSRAARLELCRLGMTSPEEVDRRLRCGDSVAIAFQQDEPVGFAWCAFRSLPIDEVGIDLLVEDDVAIGYDGYVVSAKRGDRLIARMDRAQRSLARERGRARHVVYASAGNRASIRSLDSMGRARVMTVSRLEVPPLRWRRCWTSGSCPGLRVEPRD